MKIFIYICTYIAHEEGDTTYTFTNKILQKDLKKLQ